MYILFSPSEGKRLEGGFSELTKSNLLFPELYEKRLDILNAYNDEIMHSSIKELETLTGIKKAEEIKKYQHDIFKSPTMNALERYDGVAYDYLDINSLEEEQKDFLYKNTLIFSNLFGPLLGGDKIPAYKLKQGSTVSGIKTENIYKKVFSDSIDALLKDEFILDLRAGFYEKFYTLNQAFVTMQFLKDGKSVSHWAKAYRGKVLRKISQVKPQNLQELLEIRFDGLEFVESVSYKKYGVIITYKVL